MSKGVRIWHLTKNGKKKFFVGVFFFFCHVLSQQILSPQWVVIFPWKTICADLFPCFELIETFRDPHLAGNKQALYNQAHLSCKIVSQVI